MTVTRHPWTPGEDAVLRREWGTIAWRELRTKLRAAFREARPDVSAPRLRTVRAIVRHAARLGLPLRVPQGFVTLSSAARTLGYSFDGLRTLLARHGVVARAHWCASTPPRERTTSARWRLVDFDAAREAVERDLATETVTNAARARGVPQMWLLRAVHSKGLIPPTRGGRGPIRLPSETFDALCAGRGK